MTEKKKKASHDIDENENKKQKMLIINPCNDDYLHINYHYAGSDHCYKILQANENSKKAIEIACDAKRLKAFFVSLPLPPDIRVKQESINILQQINFDEEVISQLKQEVEELFDKYKHLGPVLRNILANGQSSEDCLLNYDAFIIILISLGDTLKELCKTKPHSNVEVSGTPVNFRNDTNMFSIYLNTSLYSYLLWRHNELFFESELSDIIRNIILNMKCNILYHIEGAETNSCSEISTLFLERLEKPYIIKSSALGAASKTLSLAIVIGILFNIILKNLPQFSLTNDWKVNYSSMSRLN